MLLKSPVIEIFKKESFAIRRWSKCLKSEDSDFLQPGARIKNIITPKEAREDLNLPKLFYHSNIKQVTYLNLYPGCFVESHNHLEMSFFYKKNGETIFVKYDGIPYKTTHFVLETNPLAYFVIGNTKHTWEKDKMEEIDVIHENHYAHNPGKTHIRFLYVDYYIT
jgi:hypothetical protein